MFAKKDKTLGLVLSSGKKRKKNTDKINYRLAVIEVTILCCRGCFIETG